ncbi:hypothetical protein LCGC14_2251450, partial [marine sediment metagenome]
MASMLCGHLRIKEEGELINDRH